jgi:23S rRNA pseudouridine2457 synthase
VLSQFTVPADSDKETLSMFGFPKEVYPIGRLDWDSEGLLLLSDDASLNGALLDPSNGHVRIYWAQVENVPTDNAIAQLQDGVIVSGERTERARASSLTEEPDLPARPVPVRFRKNIPTAWIELALTEGKNRQVRKMTAAVGHPTLRLVRVAIGALRLSDLELKPGEWVELRGDRILMAFRKG